jgi:DNA-binding transcriptional LysR family regulator
VERRRYGWNVHSLQRNAILKIEIRFFRNEKLMALDWDDLRYFLAVARGGGLTAAADQLKVGVATVGRRISKLEQDLSAKLFERRPSGYILTDDGHSLVVRAEEVEERVIAVERGAAGLNASLQGTVRVALADTHATELVIPKLGVLRDRHPMLSITIITGIPAVGLTRRDADIAVRLVQPEENTLVLRRLCGHSNGLYASQSYLAERPWGRDPEISDHMLIGWDSDYQHLPAARWLSQHAPDSALRVRTTSLRAQVAAAKAGMGLAVLPVFLGDREPDLVQVLPPREVFIENLWLVYHSDLSQSRRVRTVAEFLAAIILDERTRLEGCPE